MMPDVEPTTAPHGSSTTAPVGAGNKASGDNTTETKDNSTPTVQTGSQGDTRPYSGGSQRYGSGTTAGAGFGNKTQGGRRERRDSTIGMLMEKAGSMLRNEKLEEKGASKREAAGHPRRGSEGHGLSASTPSRAEGEAGTGAHDSHPRAKSDT